jgi:sec-independent protein translocase protein TatA
MGDLKPWHIVIVVLVFVVLFGAKRLPDSAKSVAKSLRIFKDELKTTDEKKTDDGSSSTSSN